MEGILEVDGPPAERAEQWKSRALKAEASLNYYERQYTDNITRIAELEEEVRKLRRGLGYQGGE